VPVKITQAEPDRLSTLSSVFGRAFVTEPMMRWPLGDQGDIEQRYSRAFAYFLEDLIPLGMVWEAGEAIGAATWIPRDQADAWKDSQLDKPELRALAEDGGRFEAFWEWIESKLPDEPVWHLDSVAVVPEAQGGGIGSALIEFGLERARADRAGVFLETGNPRNVALYERLGFRVAEEADAPGGGPHIWFMRWDP
jgi:ribosomal protein S18 acetylase RimI-like enzyme